MKKFSLILFLTVCIGSLAVSGCWSRREVENLAIVSSVGIDTDNFKGTPKYKVTCNIIKPTQVGGGGGGGGGGTSSGPQSLPLWQISALGDTIDDAFVNILSRSPRDLFYGHVRLIVFGKDAAKQGIREVIDFALRNRDIRLRTWMVVVDGKAEDALRSMPDLEPTIAEQAAGISELTSKGSSKFFTEDINDFVNTLASPGEDPVLGRLEIIKPVPPQVGAEQSTNSLAFRGTAVFSDDKLAGWLEDSETKGFLFIIGKSRRGVIPASLGEGRPAVSLEMISAKSQIVSETENGKLRVAVKIKAEGSLEEEGEDRELANEQGLEELSGIFARQIEELCRKSVIKAQQHKTDIFGFGTSLYRKHPDQWRDLAQDWPQVFAQAEVDIEVEAKIIRAGLLARSIKSKK